MHWVIQKEIFRTVNYNLLIDALVRMSVPHTAISIPPGARGLEPEINPKGKVYVCGALKLAEISRARGWSPGHFFNGQFRFDKWEERLGNELLNHGAQVCKLKDVSLTERGSCFIRPLEDSKAFDGRVYNRAGLNTFLKASAGTHVRDMTVVVAQCKEIYQESRVFIVKGEIVTGSVYKVGGKPHLSSLLNDDVIEYVQKIMEIWLPFESCVIDIALTGEGLKVIEFNNINSSGFYAVDVPKYVEAIEVAYG
ncbi:ATP-grasp domain-containing protein [Microbulbifer guangxiensis]|uniref:ATP-grasp domain-containing protein n=1 Tax=Microbulbifer guangxiensis TaxID=2904249 RepID=UPI001F2FA8FC|nr:ATP-grasp domain-containing protein [Microbulbifer guangxiensis]